MKKILSFVLVLSLVLGSFSMAFAATPATAGTGLSDINGNANEDAIQVAYDLGIVTGNPDGTYQPAKTVTRAEFAAMITRALAIPESALTAKTSKFKDTNGYGWAVPYLAFCESKGIMLGDGNGNAMPGRTVTANEAVTMVLRAIGYTANSAELTGTWPSNYVSVAQNNNLYEDVAKNLASVDKANAAQIIYNALTVQKVSVNSDGKTDKLELDNPNKTATDKKIPATLINTGLDCTQDEHVVTGADYDNAIINVTKYMGANGTAYLNKDKDIVAFTVKDSVALTGKMDGSDFKVGDVKYTISSKANDFAKVSEPIMIQNTVSKGVDKTLTTIAAKVNEMKQKYTDDLVTINADVSGKTINEVYSIVGWKASYADTVDQSDIDDIKDKDPSLLTYDFKKDDNGSLDKSSFALVGVDSLDKIAKDNVVYVYADNIGGTSDKHIRKVAVGTQTVKGLVAEADVDNSDYTDNYVKIDGKTYEQARFNDSSMRNKLPDLDDTAVLSLDAYGYVYDTDATGGTPDKYGIVSAFDAKKSIDNAKAKIYTMDDASKTLTFVDWKDVKFTSQSGVKAVKFSDSTRPATIATPSLVGYDVDKDGYINKLDYSAKPVTTDTVLQSTKVLQITTGGGAKAYLDIDKDVVVFSYSGTTLNENTDYDLSSIKDVDTNKILTNVSGTAVQIQYIQNDDKDVVALFVNDEFTDGSNDNVYAVLNSVTKTKDGSDDVQKVVGLAGGKDYTAITDDDDDITGFSVNAANIGLYVFEPNGSNNIKKATQFTAAGYYKNDGKKDSEQCIVHRGTVTDVNSDKDVFTIGGDKFSAASNAIVYKAVMKSDNTKVDKYEVAKLGNIKKNSLIWMYDTKTGDDHDGIANIVIFQEDVNSSTTGGNSGSTDPVVTKATVAYTIGDAAAKVALPKDAVVTDYAVLVTGDKGGSAVTDEINTIKADGTVNFTFGNNKLYTVKVVKLSAPTTVINSLSFITNIAAADVTTLKVTDANVVSNLVNTVGSEALTVEYNTTVAQLLAAIAPTDTKATIKVLGAAGGVEVPTSAKLTTSMVVKVTARDNSTVKQYAIGIKAGNVTTLKVVDSKVVTALVNTSGSEKVTVEYNTAVAQLLAAIAPTDAKAAVKVMTVASGSTEATGTATVTTTMVVKVTAQDTTNKEYTIGVNPAPAKNTVTTLQSKNTSVATVVTTSGSEKVTFVAGPTGMTVAQILAAVEPTTAAAGATVKVFSAASSGYEVATTATYATGMVIQVTAENGTTVVYYTID